MFGTWKYDPETDEVQSVRNAFDPVTARSSSHQACDRCHEKKLRCSGDKNGCDRCLGNNLRCEYTRSGSKSSRKGKKKEESTSSSSATGSRRGGSSKKPSSKHHHHGHSSRTATTQEDDALGQFDFSSLSPEDGFDLGILSGGEQYEAVSGGGYAMPVSTVASHGYSVSHAPDVSYQSWDEYSQYGTAYGQQAGYQQPGGDWGDYGDYSRQ